MNILLESGLNNLSLKTLKSTTYQRVDVGRVTYCFESDRELFKPAY